MSNKEQWIGEVSQEVNHSKAALKRAIKDTGREVNSKYDVLVAYVEWSVPKLKDVEKREASYQRHVEDLKKLLYEFSLTTERLKNDFNEQMEMKNQLIDTQNQIIADREQTIAEQARIIAEMEGLLRGLPLASGE